jgi:hypothetical protein
MGDDSLPWVDLSRWYALWDSGDTCGDKTLGSETRRPAQTPIRDGGLDDVTRPPAREHDTGPQEE